ncbi:hypothetical protein EJ110_NYTH33300 [Nymphaea thermarum]|nr:hypothetical protein EJ110_NYTH33300 [Nymphaea thermarum]
MKQNQLLLSSIISSQSEMVFAQCLGLKTPHDVWNALKRSYVVHSRSRILQLKEQLQGLRKMLAHQLVVASKPVEEEDLIMHTLRRLPCEYSAFEMSLTTRIDLISLSDFHRLLLTQ